MGSKILPNPLIRKLMHGASLSKEDQAVLTALCNEVRRFAPGQDIVVEGDNPRTLRVVLEGWCCRYKQLANGRRQIVSLILAGDLCHSYIALPRFLDHSIGALTPVAVAHVSPMAIRTAAAISPHIEQALQWDHLLGTAVERERAVSLGRRSAAERLGHLICELHLRLAMVGEVDALNFELPMKQADMADLLGLSAVHVNRSLQELRATRVISLRERRVSILDLEGLRTVSLFDPAYLDPEVSGTELLMA